MAAQPRPSGRHGKPARQWRRRRERVDNPRMDTDASHPPLPLMLRPELPGDACAISQLTAAAFAHATHSSHTEHVIVDALCRHGQLTLSLVAAQGKALVGHVAVSPVTISSGAGGWHGLGPLSVAPDHQRQGIGTRLTHAALAELRHLGSQGCVVLGDPAYYGRFGFRVRPSLVLPGVPPGYFQALPFGTDVPMGAVRYHAAFDATS